MFIEKAKLCLCVSHVYAEAELRLLDEHQRELALVADILENLRVANDSHDLGWKRIWWSTYTRDRLIALGMRRPMRVKDDDCDVPNILENLRVANDSHDLGRERVEFEVIETQHGHITISSASASAMYYLPSTQFSAISLVAPWRPQ
jgi:hypothetical protein